MQEHLTAWFAAHPFWRNEFLLVLGAVSALAKKDFETFKAYQIGDPTASFNWRVAAWQYVQGIIIGGLPPIVGVLWSILGGTPP